MPVSSQRSRRERPAKPALTRDGIVAAAVAVVMSEGLESLTMRRLAAELDTGPASLYVYLRNTAELHAALLDELLGLVGLDAAGEQAQWDNGIIDVLWSYAGILFEHPALAKSALVTRPSGPNYLSLVECLLALLRRGGVSDASAAWGVDLLLLFATSIALEHGTRRQVVVEDEGREALSLAIEQAAPSVYPMIAELGDVIVSGTPRERFAWHVEVMLSGMATTPVPISDAGPLRDSV